MVAESVPQQLGGQPRDLVEPLVSRGVEHAEVVQCLQSLVLVAPMVMKGVRCPHDLYYRNVHPSLEG